MNLYDDYEPIHNRDVKISDNKNSEKNNNNENKPNPHKKDVEEK